jgi:hypothetical protein
VKKVGETLAVNWNGSRCLRDAVKDENVISGCDDFYRFVVLRFLGCSFFYCVFLDET